MMTTRDTTSDATTVDTQENVPAPSFTVSSVKQFLAQYQQGSYLYRTALWVGAPYTKSSEEIELEKILNGFSKKRTSDELAIEEIVKLVPFSYRNPAHVLCNQVANLFYQINGKGRSYDLLKLYLDKQLLTPDSLLFLFDCEATVKPSLYSFISNWNVAAIPLTHDIVRYGFLIMLADSSMACEKIIAMLKQLHEEKVVDLVTGSPEENLAVLSSIVNTYREKIAPVFSSLDVVKEYNATHPDAPSDIDLSFFKVLPKEELSSDMEALFQTLSEVRTFSTADSTAETLLRKEVVLALQTLPPVPGTAPEKIEENSSFIPKPPPMMEEKMNVKPKKELVVKKAQVMKGGEALSLSDESMAVLAARQAKQAEPIANQVETEKKETLLSDIPTPPPMKEGMFFSKNNQKASLADELRQAIAEPNLKKVSPAEKETHEQLVLSGKEKPSVLDEIKMFSSNRQLKKVDIDAINAMKKTPLAQQGSHASLESELSAKIDSIYRSNNPSDDSVDAGLGW